MSRNAKLPTPNLDGEIPSFEDEFPPTRGKRETETNDSVVVDDDINLIVSPEGFDQRDYAELEKYERDKKQGKNRTSLLPGQQFWNPFEISSLIKRKEDEPN